MATVRIYKVAELLGTTSQEVLALLKRDHGIELKSASSTIEEVVARSFVERLARQRNISLPSGDMFAETPHHAPAKPGAKKPTPTKKAEPAKPAAPVLGPPRLVKVVKPVTAPAATAPAPTPAPEPPPAPAPVAEEPIAPAPPPPPPPVVEQPPVAAKPAPSPAPPVEVAPPPPPPPVHADASVPSASRRPCERGPVGRGA